MKSRLVIAAMSILTLITALGAGVLYLVHVSETSSAATRSENRQTLSKLHDEIALYIDRHVKMGRTLAGVPELRGALLAPGDAAALAGANGVLDHYCTVLERYDCYLMDGTGLTVASSNRRTAVSFVGKNYGFRPYFQDALAGKPSLYLAMGVTSRKGGIYTGNPVRSADGTIVGVVVLKAPIDDVDVLFSNLTGIAALVSDAGLVFASNRDDWQFKTLWRGAAAAPGHGDPAQFGAQAHENLGLIRTGEGWVDDPRGIRFMMDEKPMGFLPGWSLVYLRDQNSFIQPIAGRVNPASVGFVLLILVISVMVAYLQRAADTDMKRRLKAEQALMDAHDGLEAKVQIRSAELQAEVRRHTLTLADLRQSESRFRDFAESSSDWFWEMDENLVLRYVSDRFFVLSDVAPSDIIGKTRPVYVGDETMALDPEGWRRHLDDLANHRPFRDFHYPTKSPDGRILHVGLNGVPIFGPDGAFAGYRGTGSDVTARIEAEDALRGAKVEAEAANRVKNEFLTNMSHELRTPLNAIIGFSGAMALQTFGPLGNEKYAEYVRDIQESGMHLLALINDILDVSVIEAGKLELRDEKVDLAAAVESVFKLVKARAEEGGVWLRKELPAGLDCIRADERRFKQVLLNLVGNAVKFTPSGGAVTVTARIDGDGGLVLTVADSGIGMTAAEVGLAMKQFGRADNTRVKAIEGTGLGVPLAIALTAAHGGTLDIASEPGKGTTVTVRLPAGRVVTARG